MQRRRRGSSASLAGESLPRGFARPQNATAYRRHPPRSKEKGGHAAQLFYSSAA
ncbi:Uncharacterised protein [Yersinia frederiksenii]|nr:Uncharacterised protein [Yersinia frederiksenii]